MNIREEPSSLLAIAACASLLLTALYAPAGELSPVGRWKTFDDETGKAEGIIEIRNVKGVLQGWIADTLTPPGKRKSQLCEQCEGKLKNAPIEGLRFMWGLRKEGDSWSGGKVLDPKSGDVYNVRLELQDGGRELEVRGYIGIPLLGRTQTWERVR